MDPILIIPARLAATRLPDKPLALIHGDPMIVHVWRRAAEAGLGPVLVAAAEPAIVEAVERAGGQAVLTRAGHPSGTNRIFEALERVDPAGRHDVVVNVQGDLPTVAAATVRAMAAVLARDSAVDIATAAAPIRDQAERENPNVVKAVLEAAPGAAMGRAVYFTRVPCPWGEGPLYHHIGLYAYRRERLEQLRALAAGMRIDAAIVEEVPLGVDTPADLEAARRLLAPGGGRAAIPAGR